MLMVTRGALVGLWFLVFWFLGFLVWVRWFVLVWFLDFLVSRFQSFLVSKFLGVLVSKLRRSNDSILPNSMSCCLEDIDRISKIFKI